MPGLGPRTAYLIASFDVSGPKPVYGGVGIFSESCPTTRGDIWQIIVASIEGKNFGDAQKALLRHMLRKEISGPLGHWRWLRPELLTIAKQERICRRRTVRVVTTPKIVRGWCCPN